MSPKRVSETLSPSRPDALAQARGMVTCLLQGRHFSSTPPGTRRAKRLPHGQRNGFVAEDLLDLSCANRFKTSSLVFDCSIWIAGGNAQPRKASAVSTLPSFEIMSNSELSISSAFLKASSTVIP